MTTTVCAVRKQKKCKILKNCIDKPGCKETIGRRRAELSIVEKVKKRRRFFTAKQAAEAKSSEEMMFEDVCMMWLESKRLSVKESTYARYRTVIKKHFCTYFSGLYISQITEQSAQSFIESLVSNHKPKTVKDIASVLKQIISYANIQVLSLPVTVNIRLPKESKSKTEVFSSSEYRKLLQALQRNPDLDHLGILICLQTGVRLGEICGLRFGDINFERKTISIQRTIQRIQDGNGGTRFLIDTPKTENSVREIPLSSMLMKHLEPYRLYPKNNYLLTGSDSFMQPRTYQNRFKKFLCNNGLPPVNFHVLRHTFASRAVELGFDIKSLSEILGHASVQITLNRYVHPSMEQQRKQMELFSTV